MEKDILVTRSSMPDYNEYCSEIAPLWDTRRLTNVGKIHCELQHKLREILGTDNLELFVNGHTALEMGIQALELSGEVITTPYTFASTTHALVRNGLKPVFCDIKMSDFTIDENQVESLITPKTSAILAVHVYGQPCNVEKLQEIAANYGLKLIFDAAHAFGVTIDGKSVACYGDLSMFSFHATKVFHTIEGGAVAYRDPRLGERLRLLRNFGLSGEDAQLVGGNGKMNEFSAAMGICNLRHNKENIERRKAVYAAYSEGLHGIQAIRPFLYISERVAQNYAYYPIIVNDDIFPDGRDALQKALEAEHILTRKYFYPLTNDFDCYHNMDLNRNTPVARYVSSHVLCLPMYSELELGQVKRICSKIREIIEVGTYL